MMSAWQSSKSPYAHLGAAFLAQASAAVAQQEEPAASEPEGPLRVTAPGQDAGRPLVAHERRGSMVRGGACACRMRLQHPPPPVSAGRQRRRAVCRLSRNRALVACRLCAACTGRP